MDNPHDLYDQKFVNLVEKIDSDDDPEVIAKKVNTLRVFSECRPPAPVLELAPDPVPTTAWEKFKHGASVVWDNETTRVLIKAGGAFAGVAAVVYTTVHRDHVIERQAMSQANQSNY